MSGFIVAVAAISTPPHLRAVGRRRLLHALHFQDRPLDEDGLCEVGRAAKEETLRLDRFLGVRQDGGVDKKWQSIRFFDGIARGGFS